MTSREKLIEELRTEYYDSLICIKEIDDAYKTETGINIDSKQQQRLFELLKKYKNEEFLLCGKIMQKITQIQELKSPNIMKSHKSPKQYLILEIENLYLKEKKKIIITKYSKNMNYMLDENQIYIINKLRLKIYKNTEIVYVVSMKTNFRRINEDIYSNYFKITESKIDKISNEKKPFNTLSNYFTTISSAQSVIMDSSFTNTPIEKLKSLAMNMSNYEIDFKEFCNIYQGVPIDTLLCFQDNKINFQGIIDTIKIIPIVKIMKQ